MIDGSLPKSRSHLSYASIIAGGPLAVMCRAVKRSPRAGLTPSTSKSVAVTRSPPEVDGAVSFLADEVAATNHCHDVERSHPRERVGFVPRNRIAEDAELPILRLQPREAIAMFERERLEEQTANRAEHQRVGAGAKGKRHQSGRRERRSCEKTPEPSRRSFIGAL